MNEDKLIKYALILVLLFALGTSAWNAAKDRAQLQQLLKDNKAQIDTISNNAAAQLAALAKQKQQVITVPQVVKALPQAFGPMPQPITVTQATPSSDVVVTVPQPDAKPLYDAQVECQQCKVALTACQQELMLTQQDRDAAVKAAKGGGFWSRAKAAAKWTVIGAGIGIAIGGKL